MVDDILRIKMWFIQQSLVHVHNFNVLQRIRGESENMLKKIHGSYIDLQNGMHKKGSSCGRDGSWI